MKPANISPRELTQSYGVKKLHIKGPLLSSRTKNKELWQSQEEELLATRSFRARALYISTICVIHSKFLNALQHHEAKKAVRASYEHTLHPPGMPNGYTFDKQLSGKRVKAFVHNDKRNVILAHRGTQGRANKWTDIAAVIGGRRKQSKCFQHA
jgi:hypothetical protein